MLINSAVCEGCGDCGVQSNCLSVVPLETPYGRKRAIDQSSCNKDYSCAEGFCPSFVSVMGGKPRKSAAPKADQERLQQLIAQLPAPAPAALDRPYRLLVAGMGGTGVITIGAIISMAAHLEGLLPPPLDLTGLAQKGGTVVSHPPGAGRRPARPRAAGLAAGRRRHPVRPGGLGGAGLAGRAAPRPHPGYREHLCGSGVGVHPQSGRGHAPRGAAGQDPPRRRRCAYRRDRRARAAALACSATASCRTCSCWAMPGSAAACRCRTPPSTAPSS